MLNFLPNFIDESIILHQNENVNGFPKNSPYAQIEKTSFVHFAITPS